MYRFIPFLTRKAVAVSEVANEDFCFIELGRESFMNHFPTRVAEMLRKTVKTASSSTLPD